MSLMNFGLVGPLTEDQVDEAQVVMDAVLVELIDKYGNDEAIPDGEHEAMVMAALMDAGFEIATQAEA